MLLTSRKSVTIKINTIELAVIKPDYSPCLSLSSRLHQLAKGI